MVKATVLCPGRMSWRESTVAGEVDKLADIPARAENRSNFFLLESRILQRILQETLELLINCITGRIQLADIASFYRPISTPVQTEEAFHSLTSEIRTKMLLGCIFYYGVGFAL